MKEEKRERLMLLSDLKDLRVSKDDPDIRGWDVVTADKKKMGKVHELVIDTIEMKVRYLDIDVDGKILEVKGGSHVLLPIAGAQLDDEDNRVYLTDITVDELRALPPYDHRRITREFETNIGSWFDNARGAGRAGAATAAAYDDRRPVDGRPLDTRPLDAPPADLMREDRRPIDPRPEVRRDDPRPVETRDADSRPLDRRPAEPLPPADTTADPFYEKEHFSDRNFWGRRRKGREDERYVIPDEPRK
jgi:hypothetical protein